MGYFPFFIELSGKKGVVIGGGKVAARKVEKLLEFGPGITVVAPWIGDSIWELKRQIEEQKDNPFQTGYLEIRQKTFQIEDLLQADFVIAATDQKEINRQIAAYCRERRILVNAVDDRENCTFFFPALVKDGALTVGISTEGKSPVAASWVRGHIAGNLPQGLGRIIDLLGQIRPEVMTLEGGESVHRKVLEDMFAYCMRSSPTVCTGCTGMMESVTMEELRSLFLGRQTGDEEGQEQSREGQNRIREGQNRTREGKNLARANTDFRTE